MSRRRVIARLARAAAAELEEALAYLSAGDGDRDWATHHVQRALELLWEILNAVERAG